MIVKCISKADADKVEADLRYLYFLDESESPLKWKRNGKKFVVENDDDCYAAHYLAQKNPAASIKI